MLTLHGVGGEDAMGTHGSKTTTVDPSRECRSARW